MGLLRIAIRAVALWESAAEERFAAALAIAHAATDSATALSPEQRLAALAALAATAQSLESTGWASNDALPRALEAQELLAKENLGVDFDALLAEALRALSATVPLEDGFDTDSWNSELQCEQQREARASLVALALALAPTTP